MVGRMKPQTEFSSFAFDTSRNSGMIVATCGIIMPSSRIANSRSFA